MDKEKYTAPETGIVEFGIMDVIVTSETDELPKI